MRLVISGEGECDDRAMSTVLTTQHDSPYLALAALAHGPSVHTIDVKRKLKEIQNVHNINTTKLGGLIRNDWTTDRKLFEVFHKLGGVFGVYCKTILCTQEAGRGALCVFVDIRDSDVTDDNLAQLVADADACTNAGIPAKPFRRGFPPSYDHRGRPVNHPRAYFKRINHRSIFPYHKYRDMQHGNLVGIRFAVPSRRTRALKRWRKAAWLLGLLAFWRHRATYGPGSKAYHAASGEFATLA